MDMGMCVVVMFVELRQWSKIGMSREFTAMSMRRFSEYDLFKSGRYSLCAEEVGLNKIV